MKEKLSLGLVSVACVALLASGAMGATVFFSEIGEVGQGVFPTDNLEFWGLPGGSHTLYIWSTDDQDYDTAIGMNVLSSNPASVALVGGDVANPELIWEVLGAPSGRFRWQDTSVGEVTDGEISNMNASRGTSGTGILGANNGTVPPFMNLDPLYDIGAGAFLLASVTVTVNVDGFCEMSTLSINQDLLLGDLNGDGSVNGLDVDPFVDVLLNGPYDTEADMNGDQVVNGLDVDPFVSAVLGGVGAATFVNDGQQIFPHFGTATVNRCIEQHIPEPSTLLLAIVALGVVGGWRKWRRAA